MLAPLRRHDHQATNAESPLTSLNSPITPVGQLFIRNNGDLPEGPFDVETWRLSVTGLVEQPQCFSVAELERRFPVASITTVIECAGNGRALNIHPTDGIPWGLGAVGCVTFAGIRLADLLQAAGLAPGASHIRHHGADRALKGGGPAFSRGLPLEKALQPECLLAWSMNGEPLTADHGAPLRIVAPGYPGSAWQKWLTGIEILDHVHEAPGMSGLDYRLPIDPIRPGDPVDPGRFEIIGEMPVRAICTTHENGDAVPAGTTIDLEGWAWAHGTPIAGVAVSLDEGRSWLPASLTAPATPFAWTRFSLPLVVPASGSLTAIIRATDAKGRQQPLEPRWNPRGYCNNVCQRLDLTVLG
ncbi:MAG: sulfite oxidase [Beijerinckiaceae bacterium]|nr:sulfite oxidase [Beijerinckiaceae bacterium]MCZ8301791.1 sulfite oxidase [Beijerinckiaceae bacterium]